METTRIKEVNIWQKDEIVLKEILNEVKVEKEKLREYPDMDHLVEESVYNAML